MQKEAVEYQAGLRIVFDWLGFVPYAAASAGARAAFSKASCLHTAWKRRDCCFGSFSSFLLVVFYD